MRSRKILANSLSTPTSNRTPSYFRPFSPYINFSCFTRTIKMKTMSSASYLPFIFYLGAVLILVAVMLTASYFLGERHSAKAKETPFESCVKLTGSARIHFPVHFYLIAMFFVIFDLEAIFLFIWSVSLRDTGWAGYLFILVFVAEL